MRCAGDFLNRARPVELVEPGIANDMLPALAAGEVFRGMPTLNDSGHQGPERHMATLSRSFPPQPPGPCLQAGRRLVASFFAAHNLT